MLKSEHPKSELFRVGLYIVRISDIRSSQNGFMVWILDVKYKNPENVWNPNVQTNMFGFQTEQKHLKSEHFGSDFRRFQNQNDFTTEQKWSVQNPN